MSHKYRKIDIIFGKKLLMYDRSTIRMFGKYLQVTIG